MKLIFAGLGRSGTTSIVEALDHLQVNTLSQETIFPNQPVHTHINAVLRGKEEMDWAIFDGVEAAVGWPLCWLYQEQLAHFPDAHCILNIRDPEGWYNSCAKAWKVLNIIRNARFISRLRPMQDTLNYLQEFCGGPPQKERWIAAYDQHIADVKANVPPERLTVYEVTDGWEPICIHLNKPIPNQPFPHTNTGGDGFRQKVRAIFGVG